MATDTYLRARQYLINNARPLDKARFDYLFEKGSEQAVLDQLATFQNADGGFAHALEADCWNVNSSPIQTWSATEIIRELDFHDPSHPIIEGILRYLASGAHFDGHYWSNVIASNNDYPHAPWWHYDGAEQPSDNPTASLVGFALAYAPKQSQLYQTALRVAKEVFYRFKNNPERCMHSLHCYLRLYQYLCVAAVEGFDLEVFQALLKAQMDATVSRRPDIWQSEYVCKPSFFFNASSLFAKGNESIIEAEKQFIVDTQLADGSWEPNWAWGCYEQQWQQSKRWWKCDIIIRNLLFLQGR